MIKAIIFDFDGVILESATIKTDAFAEVVRDFPKEQAAEFVQYHMTHMGISRHVKFRYFIEEILHETYSDDKESVLADKFSDIVYEKVMHCDYVPGAREFLEQCCQKYDLYIATGTPEEEIRQILAGRDLEKFFKGVYGTPGRKEDIVASIMEANHYLSGETVFVGDADTDFKAAAKNGVFFVGRNTPENREVFQNVTYKVDDLRQIATIIEKLQVRTNK